MTKQRKITSPRWIDSQERPVIELTFEDLKRICEWARARNNNDPDYDDCGVSGERAHARGLKGEYALAKHYNIPWESQPASSQDGPDDGFDFDVSRFADKRQLMVDVKTVSYSPPWLKAITTRKLKADVYVLAHCDRGRRTRVKLYGWTTRKHLHAQEPTQWVEGRKLPQENYVIQPDELNPMPEQWEVQQ